MAIVTADKTVGTTLFTAATVASGTMAIGPEIDVSTKLSGTVLIRLGRTVTGALSNPAGFKLEGSGKASGNDWWVPLFVRQNAIVAVTGIIPASNLLNGATLAGATTFVMDSATGLTGGKLLFFYEAGAYEWCRVKSTSTVTATPLDALTYAHADNTTVLDQAEEFDIEVDFTNIKRLRLIVDTNAGGRDVIAAVGQTIFVEAYLNTLDSMTIT